jgi:putative inorganic carbon (HCO3(-)) transporter
MFPQILPESIISRFSSTIQSDGPSSTMEGQLEGSAAQRIIVWRTATAMLWENPLGYGFGSFPLLLPEYLSKFGERMLSITDAHNMYLLIAVEMGVPALVVFLLIWFAAFGVSWKLYRVTSDINIRVLALGMQGCVVGALIANQFGSRFYDTEITAYFWVVLGMLVRASTFPTSAPTSPEPDTGRRAHG